MDKSSAMPASQPGKLLRWLSTWPGKLITASCVLAVAIGAWMARPEPGLKSSHRRAWKNRAVADIARFVADSAAIDREINQVKARVANQPDEEDAWISDQLVLMVNGEWLAYTNICWKEDPQMKDLFLARGSDGRWYFSTYHFCKHMISLRVERQTSDLTNFIKSYCLQPFDGRSDKSLERTWPLKGRMTGR
jgi:hypothetical protein